MVVGLLVAYRADWPAGATMAAVSVAMFFVVLLGRELSTIGRKVPTVAAV